MSAARIVEASRVVPAPAADIFDLLATPAKHPLIDGSGSVQGVQPGTPGRLSAGAMFGMQMRIGAPYKILNHVVEFEEGRRIAWRHFAGHTWRYLLEPLDANATRVTEQFDPTTGRAPLLLRLLRVTTRNQKSMEATLDRLVAWAAEPSRSRPGEPRESQRRS